MYENGFGALGWRNNTFFLDCRYRFIFFHQNEWIAFWNRPLQFYMVNALPINAMSTVFTPFATALHQKSYDCRPCRRKLYPKRIVFHTGPGPHIWPETTPQIPLKSVLFSRGYRSVQLMYSSFQGPRQWFSRVFFSPFSANHNRATVVSESECTFELFQMSSRFPLNFIWYKNLPEDTFSTCISHHSQPVMVAS